MEWPFPRAAYIEHDRDLHKLVKRLSTESLLAIDTESNSLHAYRERVCLIQLSTRTADFILDPLRIADLTPFGALLANPAIEKVFHAAEYDLICLKRDYGFSVVNLFDTMVAARILGRKAVGLDRLLNEFAGLTADKNHQRDDWGQRPLPEEGLLYAQRDTHYLPLLRDKLLAELQAAGKLLEAQELFADYAQVEPIVHTFDPEGYWHVGIPRSMSRKRIAILRELYHLREKLAEERDCPPFKIFADRILVQLAESPPNSLDDLGRLKGIGRTQADRYGRRILQAIDQGKRAPAPHPPRRPPDVDPVVAERYTRLRDWRRTKAEQRGVESDVIVSKEAMWSIAHRAPKSIDELHGIDGLGPWRLSTYGSELLAVMRTFDES
jgi:ribonuclease D